MVCLELKLHYHPDLKQLLIETKHARIAEGCSSRPGGSGKFWGAALVNGNWQGSNVLGKLWMNIRNEFQVEGENNSVLEIETKS